MRRIRQQRNVESRRGSLTPAIVPALFVVGLALALVLDRLWIDAARVELAAAAEAAALRAAHVLCSEARLRPDGNSDQIAEAARRAAADIAAGNLVAGQPVRLDTTADGDVRLGHIVLDASGREVFLESDIRPTTAVVLARRDRSRGNPVGLFLGRLTGQSAADVMAFAEASIDSRVVGLRPFEGANVPAIPLAIFEEDLTDQACESWVEQIEQRRGADLFGFDESSGLVMPTSDGIPEMTLSAGANGSNVHWIDLGNGLRESAIAGQIETGLSTDQLSPWGGSLRFDGGPLPFSASSLDHGPAMSALSEIAGERRICFLASAVEQTASGNTPVVSVRRMAAVRVMNVSEGTAGGIEVVVQPTLVCTRTAMLAENHAIWATGSESDAVAYVYKLHLTR